jgi:hypothetical protein
MLIRLPFLAAALLLAPLMPLRAGESTAPPDASAAPEPALDSTPAPGTLKTSSEFDADDSYVGNARTNFGSGAAGGVSEQRTNARFILAPQVNDGPIFRLGLAYERYGFGFSKAAPLPDILQAENLVVGVDFELFNAWLVRVEADPGLYGDARSVGFRDFNVPFTLGGSYIASEELQWIVGVGVDFDRQIPAIPAIGARWALSDDWVLDAILPTPRLEYDWSKALTLYLGSDVDDGTYRVDRGVGVALGRPKLSGAIVEYDEIRIGAGFSWKASKAITFEMEGGYLPYREFDYHRADTHFSNDDGAPYGQVSVSAQF